MDVDWDLRPAVLPGRQDWHDLPPLPQFAAGTPQTAFPSTASSQRRRSSAAHVRPAGPPPNLPIPNVPVPPTHVAPQHQTTVEAFEDGTLPSGPINGRPVYTNTYTRPSPSPSLSAVAAFSQSRQASAAPSSSLNYSSLGYHSPDDLSDPPPQSFLSSATSTSPSFGRRREEHSDQYLHPSSSELSERRTERSEQKPSSRRALTRALELAREAVQLDSTNDNPEAAVQAYARSVALLSEVMERVRRGEDSTESRRRRRRSVAAQEDEIRRLQNIHDTYADRMNILSIIYSIPAVPYPTPSSYSTTSVDSTTSNSPTTSASPSSDGSPHTPHQNPAYHHVYYPSQEMPPHLQEHTSHHLDNGSVYILDEQVLNGTAIPINNSASQHPYAATVDHHPQQPLPPTSPQGRSSTLVRRSRTSSNLPPPPPPPSNSLPPAPVLIEPRSDSLQQVHPNVDGLGRATGPESSSGRRVSESYLGALAEEQGDEGMGEIRDRMSLVAVDTPRNAKRESPPLPPLPSPPPTGGTAPGTPRNNAFLSKDPASPRLGNPAASRPRGTSQLTTRAELASQPPPHIINNTTSHGTIYRRRTKTSAPPSTRSSSPTGSTTSVSSAPQPKATSLAGGPPPPPPISQGRTRSSSQPGRRPSLGGGRVSPPPLPNNGVINGNGMRKTSYPAKLVPGLPILHLDSSAPPFNNNHYNANGAVGLLSPTQNPTTPVSPLPPQPPSDPLLKPYHMMGLLRNTITSSTGGYITRRLHVPCEVWSQGGAKLSNVLEKVRIVAILCSALDELHISSAEVFGAGNVSSGMSGGIGSIGRKEAEAWLSKVDDFSSVCDGVVANFGKKLGVGEGYVSKKTTWSDKLSRRFDKFTNGKNLDSPAAYVQGLKRLFSHSQLLDEHTRAILAQPIAPSYAAFPLDIRVSVEQRLKRSSEFFATVVLTFVIRDLSQLLDKYAKKCEKWLAE